MGKPILSRCEGCGDALLLFIGWKPNDAIFDILRLLRCLSHSPRWGPRRAPARACMTWRRTPVRSGRACTPLARNLNFFDSAQCLMVRRWRLIGYLPILYNPPRPSHAQPVSLSAIRLIQHLDSSALGLVRRWLLNWLSPYPLITPLPRQSPLERRSACVSLRPPRASGQPQNQRPE